MGSPKFEALFEEPQPEWYIFAGTCCMDHVKTQSEAYDKMRSGWLSRYDDLRAIEITPAPDGRFEVTVPWAGGTWGGMCGSTKWLDDPQFLAYGHVDLNHQVLLAWYANSRNGSAHFDQERPTPGYRVTCDGNMRHLGPCHIDVGKYIHVEWDRYESIGYEPMILALEA